MTDVAPCSCLAAKFDSCNSLLSFVHTLLVNILQCVRLYIKRKYYYYYYYYYYYGHVMRKERRLSGERIHAGHCAGSEKARKTKDAID